MRIYVKVKALAKKRPMIDKLPIEVSENIQTVNELLAEIVRKNVREYNEKEVDKQLLPYLTQDIMEIMETNGKIGFGDKKNEQKQHEESAIDNALLCFQDGIFRCFINEKEISFGENIYLHEDNELMFIRLTQLAGRLW